MSTLTTNTPDPIAPRAGWFTRTVAWLDARGKMAWIAAMVLGFVLFWPVGLVILFYMIANNKFSGQGCRAKGVTLPLSSSGNSAFDAYKADMLRRLEDEQAAFEEFLQRLREAKDKAEFDDFMEDRAKAAQEARTDPRETDKEDA